MEIHVWKKEMLGLICEDCGATVDWLVLDLNLGRGQSLADLIQSLKFSTTDDESEAGDGPKNYKL